MEEHNIWNSYEGVAWSMSFDYNQYLEHHKLWNCRHSPLSMDAYDAFYDILTMEMENSFK